MKPNAVPVLLVVGLLVVAAPKVISQEQQQKPDFSGTWVLNPVKSEKAIVQGHSAVRGQMVITVTEKQATFAWMLPGDDGKPAKPQNDGFTERTTVCAFGNTPAENVRPMVRVYCSAKWNGNELVTTSYEPTFPLAAKGTRPLGTSTYSVSGNELKVSGVVPSPRGGDPFTSEVFWDRK